MSHVLGCVLAAALLVGCGRNECSPLRGQFKLVLTLIDGNCGPSLETVVRLDPRADPWAYDICDGDAQPEFDWCRDLDDLRPCRAFTRERADIAWDVSGSSGAGRMALAHWDGDRWTCIGSYDAKYSKL